MLAYTRGTDPTPLLLPDLSKWTVNQKFHLPLDPLPFPIVAPQPATLRHQVQNLLYHFCSSFSQPMLVEHASSPLHSRGSLSRSPVTSG